MVGGHFLREGGRKVADSCHTAAELNLSPVFFAFLGNSLFDYYYYYWTGALITELATFNNLRLCSHLLWYVCKCLFAKGAALVSIEIIISRPINDFSWSSSSSFFSQFRFQESIRESLFNLFGFGATLEKISLRSVMQFAFSLFLGSVSWLHLRVIDFPKMRYSLPDFFFLSQASLAQCCTGTRTANWSITRGQWHPWE